LFKLDGQIDIHHIDLRGDVQANRCKVQDSANAGGGKLRGHFLGMTGRHGENRHVNGFFAKNVGNIVHGANLFPGQRGNRLADLQWIAIHYGDDLEAFADETAVGGQGRALIADSDQQNVPGTVRAENMPDPLDHVGDGITDPGLTELAEIG